MISNAELIKEMVNQRIRVLLNSGDKDMVEVQTYVEFVQHEVLKMERLVDELRYEEDQERLLEVEFELNAIEQGLLSELDMVITTMHTQFKTSKLINILMFLKLSFILNISKSPNSYSYRLWNHKNNNKTSYHNNNI